jgi:sugar phosphate isomerase/epimerase
VGPDFDAGLVTAVTEAGEIGFQGIETNWRMIKTWGDRADEFRDLLDRAGVQLSALFFGAGSAEATAARQELDDALRTAAFVAQMGGGHMMVGGGKATDDPNVFRAVCGHFNDLGKAVFETHGVKACYHLHHGAIACSPEEIARMLDLTDEKSWFLCPDSGIMVSEGHDLVKTIREFAARIPYVHFKDWSGDTDTGWSMLGKGVVDHAAALETLDELNYDGWVISENESKRNDLTPKQRQQADRDYLRSLGY